MTKIIIDLDTNHDVDFAIYKSKEDWDVNCFFSVPNYSERLKRSQSGDNVSQNNLVVASDIPVKFPCVAIGGTIHCTETGPDEKEFMFIYDYEVDEVKTFTLYWKYGDRTVIKGTSINNAFTSNGHSVGALSAVDWYDEGETNTHVWVAETKSWMKKPKTADFLCSLNKKHSNQEVLSFVIKVPYNELTEDPHSLDVKRRAQFQAADSDEVKKLNLGSMWGNTHWMDAVCMEPKTD